MAIRTELTVRLPNSPGALADVCAAIAAERVRVLALHLDASGTLRLVVDNPVRTLALLRERRHTVSEKDVLVVGVPNAAGALASVLALVRDAGVNIDYAYGAASSERSESALAVLGVADAVRAASAAGV